MAGDGRIRTYGCQSQSLVPYHLATSQCVKWLGGNIHRRFARKGNGVGEGTRTLGLQSHNPITNCATPTIFHCRRTPVSLPKNVARQEGTRTPNLLLRRQLLYPAELLAYVERVTGIEPARPAWKAGILPLNYTRMGLAVISPKIVSYVKVVCQDELQFCRPLHARRPKIRRTCRLRPQKQAALGFQLYPELAGGQGSAPERL